MKDLQKYVINNIELKNRFVLAPMTTYSGNDDLSLSNEEENYYKARGKEFGIVITAATAVSKHAQAFTNQISAMDKSYLPSLKRLAKAIKSGGALAILQVHHGGRMNASGLYENQDIVSASAIKANRKNALTPRALSTDEVYRTIEDFRQAILLAIKAGFDGIELHGANTYLIQQFFSPHSNQRSDEFGGSLEKRMTFPLKLVDMALKVKEEYANDNFIVGYRLSPEELEEPGITLDDTKALIKALSTKEIDYIHLSLGTYNQSSIRDQSNHQPIISILKPYNVGNVPMIGVGGIETKSQAQEALDLGFDLVAIGKAALSDVNVVSHILSDKKIKKVIDEDSILPQAMKERIKSWSYLSTSGYSVK